MPTFKAIDGWAIWHPGVGIILHSIAASKMDAWARLRMISRPEEWQGLEEHARRGFKEVQVRIKYAEPEPEK
jgi:hypothetical protein